VIFRSSALFPRFGSGHRSNVLKFPGIYKQMLIASKTKLPSFTQNKQIETFFEEKTRRASPAPDLGPPLFLVVYVLGTGL
jgi:hypothetical protein